MPISSQLQNGEFTIQIGPKFDFDATREFREAYEFDEAKKHNIYNVDFRDTEYMDSSGLGMLLNMRDFLDDAVEINLINCRSQVKKVLMISRFDKKFTID
ncbi:MAG: STAS domain-containing protein [Pseudomonadales bacterium]|nr:STAS domain-containing protein [Pseudomonadales bacterium]